jgi:dephospho-CoA kinase
VRLTRLVELRGMSPEEAVRRVDAQADDEARLAVADLVVDSSISLEATLARADEVAEVLRSLSAAKAGGPSGPSVSGRS